MLKQYWLTGLVKTIFETILFDTLKVILYKINFCYFRGTKTN